MFYGVTASRGLDDLGIYLVDPRNQFTVVKTSVYIAQAMLGDSVLVSLAESRAPIQLTPGMNRFGDAISYTIKSCG